MSFSEQFNKAEFDFQFITPSRIRLTAVFSGVLLLISLVSFFTKGLNLGIDFSGGTLVQVAYENTVELTDVRGVLQSQGYGDAVVLHFGTAKDVLIRVGKHGEKNSEAISSEILLILKQQNPQVEIRRVEYIGPQVGEELIEAGGLAMLYTLFGILIYVSMRFEWRFAFGAVLALVHDSIITVGVFSVTGMEFDLTVLAAVLAVIGYSLNDTIVVFDRIRENFLKMRKRTPVEVMNASINQTLIRTLMTSLTTLLVVLALFFLGGALIHGFSAALTVGIIVGTYSSIYVASSVTLATGISKADLIPPVKEGVESNQEQT